MGQTKEVRTLNFIKLQLFKELVSRTLWETALGDRQELNTAEQSWQILKDSFHRAQELSIPEPEKLGREGKTGIAEWGPAGQTKGQKVNVQTVEEDAGILERA